MRNEKEHERYDSRRDKLLESYRVKYSANKEVNLAGQKKRRESLVGYSTVMYANQKRASKMRGMAPPTYTIGELREWLVPKGFEELLAKWIASGKKKEFPSGASQPRCA